jgi:FkbM family methyltransferase
MLDFIRQLTLQSAAAYAAWRIRGSTSPIELVRRSGTRFELRPDTIGNGDYGVAYEVFVHDYYRIPAALRACDVRCVVDIGANVGMSVLYWLEQFPRCRILAFEPHPRHAEQARRNIALNGQQHRVELRTEAAGAKSRGMLLSDQGASSALVADGTGVAVEVVDVFPHLIGRPIDILKLDMEGGEYELLEDVRFATLLPRAIVMEWHTRRSGEEDRRWCETRLKAMGFTIETLFSTPTHGMFWAVRVDAA